MIKNNKVFHTMYLVKICLVLSDVLWAMPGLRLWIPHSLTDSVAVLIMYNYAMT